MLRRRCRRRELAVPSVHDRPGAAALFLPARSREADDIVAATATWPERRLDPSGARRRPGRDPGPAPRSVSVDAQSSFLRLALRPDVIAAVCTYLGSVGFSRCTIAPDRMNRRFSLDADAMAQVKIFSLQQMDVERVLTLRRPNLARRRARTPLAEQGQLPGVSRTSPPSRRLVGQTPLLRHSCRSSNI